MNRTIWIFRVAVACLIAFTSWASAADSSLPTSALGHWHGSVQIPSGSMALELNIYRSEPGALAATLESVDQAPGELIPVSRIRIEGGRLSLEMDTLSASYEGRFDEGNGAWLGSWRQGITLPLIWTRGAVPPQPKIDGLDGIWRGALLRNGAELRLILHIKTSGRGTRAKLDSPDMGIAGLDVADLSRVGDHVHFRVPLANVVYEGDLADKAMSLSGP